MFETIKGYLWIIEIVGVVAILAFAGYKAYHFGYDRAEVVWSAKYNKLVADVQTQTNKEIQRQKDANEAAQQLADSIIARLQQQNEILQSVIDQNAVEAANDTTVKDGISKSGVDRLNKVR